ADLRLCGAARPGLSLKPSRDDHLFTRSIFAPNSPRAADTPCNPHQIHQKLLFTKAWRLVRRKNK
ncbi:MAG TPA: hypothetical protein VK648_04865, partial [Gemmatimonadaceae bacterium]|nr:hypothetical protein [Gemmatimonadaceae bacterium]